MRELPSRGRCHAAFLLAYSAQLRRIPDLPSWVASASSKSTIMAGSLDMLGTANVLLGLGLARLEECVELNRRLASLAREADRPTLLGIARLILERSPPPWIATVVSDGVLALELIPDADLRTLSWLEDDLEPILISIHRRVVSAGEDEQRKILGDAGELAIMSALRRQGHRPVHVALISDSYGYDLESQTSGGTDRIEVKAAVMSTKHRFFLSRNEYDKAEMFGTEWRLVQVVFSSRVILQPTISAADVEMVREMSGADVRSLAAADLPTFRWTEAAEFRTDDASWLSSSLVVDPAFQICARSG